MFTRDMVRPMVRAMWRMLDAPAVRRGSAWSPAQWFLSGEQGIWLDPSDFATMFQDAAGTTPVTAVGQPVGLVLDKSQGLVLGSELVANGTFDAGTTGWIAGNSASLSVVGQKLRVQHGGGDYPLAAYDISTVAGKTYRIHFSVTRGTSPSGIGLRAFNLPFLGGGAQLSDSGYKTASGDYVCVFKAVSSTSHIYFLVNTETVGTYDDVDNVSIRELSGNHASQATAAARPVLSARKNWLLSSSQVGDDNWATAGTGPTITLNAALNPLGVMEATRLAFTATGFANRLQQFTTVKNKAGLGAGLGVVSIYLRGTVGGEVIVVWNGQTLQQQFTLTTEWQRYVVPAEAVDKTSVNCLLYAVSGTPTIEAWGAQVEPSSPLATTPTTYQRIDDGGGYDTVGFPRFLLCDGVDDKLTTTFPNLGTNVTIASAIPGVGTTILTGQTIGAGVWDDNTDHCGIVIINRALTAPEAASLTAYLNAKAGV